MKCFTGCARNRVAPAPGVQKLGDSAHGINADAGSLVDIDRMYAEIMQAKGKLDVVFANAGVYKQVPWNRITEEEYDKTFAINAKGVFFTIQKAIP